MRFFGYLTILCIVSTLMTEIIGIINKRTTLSVVFSAYLVFAITMIAMIVIELTRMIKLH